MIRTQVELEYHRRTGKTLNVNDEDWYGWFLESLCDVSEFVTMSELTFLARGMGIDISVHRAERSQKLEDEDKHCIENMNNEPTTTANVRMGWVNDNHFLCLTSENVPQADAESKYWDSSQFTKISEFIASHRYKDSQIATILAEKSQNSRAPVCADKYPEIHAFLQDYNALVIALRKGDMC